MARQYFGTDGIRCKVGSDPLTPHFLLQLGWAIGKVFGQGDDSRVLIGKDTRASGYLFESALEAGLSAAGASVSLIGPLPTPAIAYLTRTLGAQAGIVISASHNPHYDNGIKIFSSKGFKLSEETELAIEHYLGQPLVVVPPEKLGKVNRINDALSRYLVYCKGSMSENINLKGLKIVVDCAHGAAYQVAPMLLKELGATLIELGVSPNGFNINEACGSTHPEALSQRVLADSADLGIAFDGDADRLIMIDERGEVVDGDELLFVMVNNLFKKGQLEGGVVGTQMSNLGLERSLESLGIEFVRAKVGDRHVMEVLVKKGWKLGGESSGHLVNLGLTTTGDGLISALQVLSAMVEQEKTLNELKSVMTKFPQTLINVKMPAPASSEQQKKIDLALESAQSSLGERGRILLRPSGTEPIMRVMVEGEDPTFVESSATSLASEVEVILN